MTTTTTVLTRFSLTAGLAATLLLAGGSGFAQVSGPTKGQAPPDRAYYVILDTTSKTCSVVDKEPKTDSAHITVATDAVYATRGEAEKAVSTLKPCMR